MWSGQNNFKVWHCLMEFTGEDVQNVDYKNIEKIWGKLLPTF